MNLKRVIALICLSLVLVSGTIETFGTSTNEPNPFWASERNPGNG